MLRLTGRLAWRNLRAHPAQAGLLLFTMSLVTTVLSMALGVRETGNGAWDRLWRATDGPDRGAGVRHRVTLAAERASAGSRDQ